MTTSANRAIRLSPEQATLYTHDSQSEQVLATHNIGFNPQHKGYMRGVFMNGAGHCVPTCGLH